MRVHLRTSASLALIILLGGCLAQVEEATTNTGKLGEDADTVSQTKILFGHQSVGNDILRELKTLLDKDVGKKFPIIERSPGVVLPGAYLLHSRIGTNGRPVTKFRAFSFLLEELKGERLDVALLKLCYADFNDATNVDDLFYEYCRLLDALRSYYPDTTFVHVTVPLRSSPRGLRNTVKRLFRQPLPGDFANAKRQEYNERLRRRYAGEAVFDLAAVESTLPDGERVVFKSGGRPYFELAREYTSDGGHLNELGGRLAATELLRVLAAVVKAREAQARH